nr:TonB-dependent receptor [uncultured Carboxylicivirga sp.]
MNILIDKMPGVKISRVLLLLIFVLSCQLMLAQTKRITGSVVEPNGAPVPGANIIEKGTTNGTITDFDGHFVLDVPEDATITVMFIGFSPQDISVAGRNHFSVTLHEDTEELDEVVVVGFGVQKKESVVGAIASVGTEELLKSSSPNISQAISGRMSGVITSQSSGAPGADDAMIFIRGRASFAGDNQPLIMVDGVERSFSQISPDDIESVNILKDASATAVYGVRGANGVILVTTKRGKEQKPTINLTANYQMQTPTRTNTYLDSYQSVMLLEEARANDGLSSLYSASDIDMFRKSSLGQLSRYEQQLYPNVNWHDEILKKVAPASRYNLNVQGGTKKMRYFASLEYYNQGGLYKETDSYDYGASANANYERFGFRANLDFDLTSDLKLGINFGTRFEERNGPNITDNSSMNEVFYELNHTPGWIFPVQYENGFYGGNAQNQNNISARLASGGFYEQVRTINETNFNLDYDLSKITKGLKARGMLSFDYNTMYNRLFRANFATYELIDRSAPEEEASYTRYGEDTELAYAGNQQETMMKLYMEYAFQYNRNFGGIHNVGGLVLYNQNDYQFQASLPKRYQGLVGRVTYDYKSKYFAEVNAGYNGSENFQKGSRFGFFPAFSAGWMISNEEWMEKHSEWLSALKVKASYGEVGNDVFRRNGSDVRFLYMDSWTQLNNVYYFGSGNSSVGGIYEGQYPNYAVTWERAKKYNAGIEANIKSGLLSVNVDVFKEIRNNILTDYLTKPDYIGVTLAPGNLGETKNQGFEIELKHNNKIGQVNYFVNAMFTRAKNEIVSKNEPADMTEYRKREGHAINQFFGLVVDGFVTQEDIDSGNLPVSSFGTVRVGDLKYRDMNGDGFIDERDETFIGYSDIPENTYSFSVGADYKGFAFSVMFQGVSNVSRYYDAEAMYAFVDGGKVKEHHMGRWDPSKSQEYNLANATYPLLHYDDFGNHNQQRNSFFLQNGNFLRLKNIEFSYTLPNSLTQNWKMSKVRLYVNANNLFTWDNLDGIVDPETTNSNLYPIMKTVNMGVNVNF